MARVATRIDLSPAAFLDWERAQVGRHEYFHGQVFAMAGGSPRHNALSVNVATALAVAFRGSPCRVFSSDQQVGLAAGTRYVYPDLTVVCGAIEIEPGTKDVVTNPRVVVEVLSASTEPYDRGLKWEGYQGIPSLSDYVIVSQSEPRLEHFQRESEGVWRYRAAGPGGRIALVNGALLVVDELFEGVFEIPGD